MHAFFGMLAPLNTASEKNNTKCYSRPYANNNKETWSGWTGTAWPDWTGTAWPDNQTCD